MTQKKIIVIGGGPAGLMAAYQAAAWGEATLLERNARPARKLLITGKGRCNVTNDADLNGLIAAVPQNGRFLFSAFSRFTAADTVDFLRRQGVETKVERGRRVFPASDRAMDVADALVAACKKAGVHFAHGRARALRMQQGEIEGVMLEDESFLPADAVILCTGGLSYPVTGSTGDGYRMAAEAGHTIVPARPSLVPLVAEEAWCAELQGLSPRNVLLTLVDRPAGKVLYREQGEMLFTHFGVSGPLVLSASAHIRHMQPGRYQLLMDWKPALPPEQLDARLQRDLLKYQNRDYRHALEDLLPHKLIPVFVRLSGIPQDCKAHSITREMRARILALMKGFPITIRAFRPVEEAIITSGGVSVKEVNPKTMESKLVTGLYFAGEVLDVDAYTGGFNLQIAWSTGFLAGRSAANA